MIYVLIREINQYEQDGEYLVWAGDHRPTITDLCKFLKKDLATHVLSTGGGRIEYENEWFHLKEVPT